MGESETITDFDVTVSGHPPDPDPVETAQSDVATSAPPAELPEPAASDDADSATPPPPRNDQGQFTRKGRHRASRQQASREDVPRIQELTARLREVERERDALKAGTNGHGQHGDGVIAAATGSLSEPQRTAAAPPRVAPPVPSTDAPKPKPVWDQYLAREQDFGVAMAKYAEDLSDWKADERDRARRQADFETFQKSEQERIRQNWVTKTRAAAAEYPDFEAVAIQQPTRIPPGSLIDAWIWEHRQGAKILYHLQKHPGDLDALLQLPPFDQAEQLSLLAQRLSGQSSPRRDAGTGASPAVGPQAPPRPPTPVRTSAPIARDEPPDPSLMDLDAHEAYWGTPRRSHRR